MIPISGMNARLGLQLVDATSARQAEMIRNSAQHARAITTFRDRVSAIETVDQLMADRDLYVFVMKAFDLEDQIFGKAMIGKVLKSDIGDRSSLVNRLTDPRFREMHEVLGFGPNGVGNLNTLSRKWREAMVDRYVQRQFINAQADQNETVGSVLEFRRKAGTVRNAFDILKDRQLAGFLRTALGIPEETVQLDIDRQAEILRGKLDLGKLQDPKEVEKLVARYVAISDATNAAALQQNAAVQLMNGALAAGAGGRFVPVTIDIAAISATPRLPYA
ncbi:DUF1217 domain-containing protein [Actibacterium sp. MT2.3-13A]|uniref:DUF1217 domain-containing protein n=1 Tax=Actibacterium sp. MT2.3-13A TaxID=2828332 RepID=UPI001BA4C398|nr:DUF1217 domain-containing protein [Actibacterium sp. MT2.3-13A]